MRSPQDILKSARTIAVVGASDSPEKAAHKVPLTLRGRGYTILPVNPNDPEVLGVPSVASVADLPDGVDVVDVFRPGPEAADIVRAVVERGIPAVWLQAGITSDEARVVAQQAGIDYVEDTCMAVVAAVEDLRVE